MRAHSLSQFLNNKSSLNKLQIRSYSFVYSSNNTFLKFDKGNETSKYAIAGIPYDGATTNRPGARFGPSAIRNASHMICEAIHPVFNTVPFGHVTDYGDLTLPNTSIERVRVELERLSLEHIKKQHMVWLGGDHSITLSLLRSYYQVHGNIINISIAYLYTQYQRTFIYTQRFLCLGKPLSVVHFDAHCDTWPDHFSEPSGHGTWVSIAVCYTTLHISSILFASYIL